MGLRSKDNDEHASLACRISVPSPWYEAEGTGLAGVVSTSHDETTGIMLPDRIEQRAGRSDRKGVPWAARLLARACVYQVFVSDPS
jgi:hypothetical protein